MRGKGHTGLLSMRCRGSGHLVERTGSHLQAFLYSRTSLLLCSQGSILFPKLIVVLPPEFINSFALSPYWVQCLRQESISTGFSSLQEAH